MDWLSIPPLIFILFLLDDLGHRGADKPIGLPAYPIEQEELLISFRLRLRKLEAARLSKLVFDGEKALAGRKKLNDARKKA